MLKSSAKFVRFIAGTLFGFVAGLLATKAIQDKKEEPQRWRDAWSASSAKSDIDEFIED